jgi:hypothetical protein
MTPPSGPVRGGRRNLDRCRHALREQRDTVANTAQDIEDQLNALDPVTRAVVVARLTTKATQDIKSRVSHH